jgi:hypothetical protein
MAGNLLKDDIIRKILKDGKEMREVEIRTVLRPNFAVPGK